MIELPEACVLASQCNATLRGKRITNVVAAHSPHKFAWYFGDPADYHRLLSRETIGESTSYGGQLEIAAGSARLVFSDGVSLRYFAAGERVPDKHQLLLLFEDGSFLVGSVQMYGGLSAFTKGANDNKYYLVAREKPSPLSEQFDEAHFDSLLNEETEKLSLKALLATEQRIPGLGNGVLQDILFNAGLHPKKKAGSLADDDRTALFASVKRTLAQMVAKGGRDTEVDLFGTPGLYLTKLSRNTAGNPCPVCGGPVSKEAYLGGSIYYCANCQRQ